MVQIQLIKQPQVVLNMIQKQITVIHNYFKNRSDGTTAAERFFKTKIPDPFEWLVENMGDLPLPRKSTRRKEVHP